MAKWDDTIDTTEKVSALQEKRIKPVGRQTSSAGYAMSFSLGTITKRALKITYAWLALSDKTAIETFFDENQGTAFTMDNPDPNSSEVLTLIFDQDDLEFEYTRVFPGEYALTIEVKEV